MTIDGEGVATVTTEDGEEIDAVAEDIEHAYLDEDFEMTDVLDDPDAVPISNLKCPDGCAGCDDNGICIESCKIIYYYER